MQQILIYFFIAVGLSMDAFSLALAYGTNQIVFSKMIILSLFVGIFHFFMPYFGSILGNAFLENFITKADKIVAIVFLILAIEMFLSRNESKKGMITNFLSILFFSFTVSIDSFSVGLALGITQQSIVLACITFAITSACFTLLGLISGKKLSEKFGKKAIYFGIFILTLLALDYFF